MQARVMPRGRSKEQPRSRPGANPFPRWRGSWFPVYSWMGLPGRFGALWVAELWFRNSTDEFVVFGFGDLGVILPGGGWVQISPRAAGPYSSGSAQRGAIYVVEKAFAEEVHLALRIADVSRRPISHGTEVPIVRERDWISRPVELLDVPTDFAVRQTLRVYEPDGSNDTAVRVIVYPARENEAIAEAVLEPRGGSRFFEGVHSGTPCLRRDCRLDRGVSADCGTRPAANPDRAVDPRNAVLGVRHDHG
jgi:hypothetical protein